MTNEQYEKFLARAERLGHSRTELQKRGVQKSTVTLHTLEDVRKLLRSDDPKVCETRESDISRLTGPEGRTFEQRLESYLHGTGDLSITDMKQAEKGLPMTVECASADEYTLPHGETVVGPSGSPTLWNYGTMNFYSDSYLTVQNMYFTLTVQTLNMQYTGA